MVAQLRKKLFLVLIAVENVFVYLRVYRFEKTAKNEWPIDEKYLKNLSSDFAFH